MPAVVLNHHLLNLNRRMTLITLQDGKVVMRDGKVGTEQACCCGGCCCVDGVADGTKTTREACEECLPAYECFDENTFEFWPVADCSECDGAGQSCYQNGTTGPCGTWIEKDCSQVCCGGHEFGQPFVLLRDDGGCLPEDIPEITALLESNGYSIVSHVEEIPGQQFAWYVTCCGTWCGYTFYADICGVPYNICGCSAFP